VNDFDSIAPYYDSLSTAIFGRSLRASQEALICHIPDNAHVLILGGGTGKTAQAILQSVPGVKVIYVEKSQRMLSSARNRLRSYSETQVIFINKSWEQYEAPREIDVVVAQDRKSVV